MMTLLNGDRLDVLTVYWPACVPVIVIVDRVIDLFPS